MISRRCSALLALCASAACTPDRQDDGPAPQTEVEPPPAIEPKAVPAAPDAIEGETVCVSLSEGEKLWSVSPEGHAWFAGEQVAGMRPRVIDPWDPTVDSASDDQESYELGTITVLHAWSAEDASLLADGIAWQLDGFARTSVSLPDGVSEAGSLCGSPRDGGYLIADGSVYQRRAEQWWGWDLGASSEQAPRHVVPFGGECTGLDDALWLTADDGALWRITSTSAEAVVGFEALGAAAGTRDLLAVIDGDVLWMNTPPAGQPTLGTTEGWQPWIFSTPTPAQLSASDGAAWMLSGDMLLRYLGGSFVQVGHEMNEAVVALRAHAGGVWLAGETTACHVSVGPALRVHGVHPFGHTKLAEQSFGVEVSDPTLPITAELDAREISLTYDEASGLLHGTAPLDGAGWHLLQLSTGGVERTVPIRQDSVSWERDIAPIYEGHCASCHGTGSAIPLDSEASWLQSADAVRLMVVESASMPPAEDRKPEWSSQEVMLIAQWLDAQTEGN